MQQISVCLTTYNRSETTIKAFEQVLDDERVSEIVIVDDTSDIGFYTSLKFMVDRINNGKIKLYRNEVNLDCYLNKREAVGKATSQYLILLDSDNILTKKYIDKVYKMPWFNSVILQPSFAKPHFDFSKYSGMVFYKDNVNIYIEDGVFQTMLNACNYFVNKNEYLKVFDDTINPVTSDSIYQAYNWLKNGGGIEVVRDLEYDHPISHDSHYKANVKRTPQGFHEEVLQKLRELR